MNTQTEMKYTLLGTMKQKIKSVVWKIRKQKTPNHNNKKRKNF